MQPIKRNKEDVLLTWAGQFQKDNVTTVFEQFLSPLHIQKPLLFFYNVVRKCQTFYQKFHIPPKAKFM